MNGKQESYRAEQFKFPLAFALLAAVMCCGCVWGHIERSQPLTREVAGTLVGEVGRVSSSDAIYREVTILGLAGDSLRLASASGESFVHYDSVRQILVEGSLWGRLGGGLTGAFVGGVVGYALAEPHGTFGKLDQTVSAIGGAALGAVIGGLVGEGFGTPDKRYIMQKYSAALHREGKDVRYVLAVDRLVEETDTYVAISWQGEVVKLPKSEITVEKSEKGFRLTVPARLLPMRR